MIQSIWSFLLTTVGNRGITGLRIFPPNLLSIIIMCPWDIGSGYFYVAEWGWTQRRDELWNFCKTKAPADEWGGLLLGWPFRVPQIAAIGLSCCIAVFNGSLMRAAIGRRCDLGWRGCLCRGLTGELSDGYTPTSCSMAPDKGVPTRRSAYSGGCLVDLGVNALGRGLWWCWEVERHLRINCSPFLSSNDCSSMRYMRLSSMLHSFQRCDQLGNIPTFMCSSIF